MVHYNAALADLPGPLCCSDLSIHRKHRSNFRGPLLGKWIVHFTVEKSGHRAGLSVFLMDTFDHVQSSSFCWLIVVEEALIIPTPLHVPDSAPAEHWPCK